MKVYSKQIYTLKVDIHTHTYVLVLIVSAFKADSCCITLKVIQQQSKGNKKQKHIFS